MIVPLVLIVPLELLGENEFVRTTLPVVDDDNELSDVQLATNGRTTHNNNNDTPSVQSRFFYYRPITVFVKMKFVKIWGNIIRRCWFAFLSFLSGELVEAIAPFARPICMKYGTNVSCV